MVMNLNYVSPLVKDGHHMVKMGTIWRFCRKDREIMGWLKLMVPFIFVR